MNDNEKYDRTYKEYRYRVVNSPDGYYICVPRKMFFIFGKEVWKPIRAGTFTGETATIYFRSEEEAVGWYHNDIDIEMSVRQLNQQRRQHKQEHNYVPK